MKKYLYLIKNSKIPTYLKYWLMYSSKKISLLIQSLPITLENTIKDLKIVINKIYGNSEQVQYSGKNLLNKELFVSTNLGNWEVEQIENGIRVTHKNNYSSGVPTVTVQLKPNTTYTYSQKQMTGFSIIEDGGSIKYPSTGKATLTTGNLGTITITIVVAENTTAEFTYMQLEEGSTATSYEPYVGGTASPNPDYPQEITNVTGDVEVKVQNKNLINFSNEQFNVYKEYQNLNIPAGTYTFSSKITSSDTDGSICRVYFYGTDVSPVFINLDRNIRSSATVTLNGTYNRIILYASYDYIHSTGDTAVYEDCQLEQGTASTYTPYKEQTFTFPLGNEKLMLGDYLADDGIHHVRGQATESGTTITLNDAKSGGAYLCNKKTSGNLVGKTLTFDEAITDALIEYELAEEVIVPYTSAQQEVYNQIKQAISYEGQTNISSNQNIYLDIDYIKRG